MSDARTEQPAAACEACGFQAARHPHADLVNTASALGSLWWAVVEGRDPAVLTTRPPDGAPSALERAVRSGDDVLAAAETLSVLTGRRMGRLGRPSGDGEEPPMREAVLHLDRAARQFGLAAAGLDADLLARPVSDEAGGTTGAFVGAAVHTAVHALQAVGRGFRALGHGPPTATGTLVQVSASSGGVPKQAVPSAVVDGCGVQGDRQAERRIHGRPYQALCLWSAEVIATLAGEGHRVVPGAAGENLTVAGVDWADVRPGVRLAVGEVLADVSIATAPCAKNARWFANGDIDRMDHQRNPGAARMYAWVVRGGRVAPGDPVILEP